MCRATSREKPRWAIQKFLTSNSKHDRHAYILVIKIDKGLFYSYF